MLRASVKEHWIIEINKHSRVHLNFITSPTCLGLKGFVAADAVHYYTIQVRFCDRCAITKKWWLIDFRCRKFPKIIQSLTKNSKISTVKKNRDGKDTSTYVNTVIQLLIYILYGSANSFDLHPGGTDWYSLVKAFFCHLDKRLHKTLNQSS